MSADQAPIDVPSPCVAVCRIDPATNLCEGCARSIDEISDWLILDPLERLSVWARICADFGVPLERALAGKVGAGRARDLMAWRDRQTGRLPRCED